jgi:DNA repair protein RadD
MLPLRGHQQENFDELSALVGEGRNPLLVAPCGYGKGVLISHIVHSALRHAREGGYSVSIIFGVHGLSLCADMSGRLRRAGIPHGVLMGGVGRQRWHPVQVASLDTLARMTHPPACDIFIVDEAHLALAPIWKKTIERFPDARIIGMTATPVRMDGKGLGRATGGFFDTMVLGPSVPALIRDGYLVRSRVLEPPPVEGAKDVKLKGNDNLGAQAAVFDKVKLIGDEIDHYKKHATGRKGVTFCADQKHAAHVAEAFTVAGIPWAYVDASTPMGDENNPQPGTRAAIWRDLDAPNGNLMGISNVGITQIGWDHPIVSYLGVMRRTGSFGLWHQMLGRGSRIHPGKTDFLVIDHAGNSALHAPMGYFESDIEWSLDGEAVKPGTGQKERIVRTCKQSFMNCECGKPGRADAGPGDHDISGTHWPCSGTFPSGPDDCPWCKCPVPRKSRKIETVSGELRELSRPDPLSLAARVAGEFSLASPSRVNRRDLEMLLLKAKKEGKRPGWAKHVLEARTGAMVPPEWMPREWREEKGL